VPLSRAGVMIRLGESLLGKSYYQGFHRPERAVYSVPLRVALH